MLVVPTPPFDIKTRKFSYYNAKNKVYGQTRPMWPSKTGSSDRHCPLLGWISISQSIWEIQRIFQNYGGPDDIYPYSIDEALLTWPVSLNYFVPDRFRQRCLI